MSFFNLKECRTINKTELFYNYKPITIYNSDISEKTNNNDNTIMKKQNTIEKSLIQINNIFYKIQVNNKNNNFTYNVLKPSDYTLSNIYLYGLIHNNISDITTNDDDIVGEIVLEHTSSETNSKIYVCVLIRRSEQKLKSTMIDKLVSNIQNLSDIKYTEFDFNVEIPEQSKCIHYKDIVDSNYSSNFGMYGTIQTNNEIFIFIDPIVVSSETASFFNSLSYETNLFKIDAPIYPTCIKFQETTVEGFVEGATNYMECTLANESEETVLSTTVPINDNILSSLNGYKMVVNSLFFILFGLITYLAIPGFYEIAIITNIKSNLTILSPQPELSTVLQGADIIISFIIFIHIFIYILLGSTHTSFYNLIAAGIVITGFYIISYSLIYYNKIYEWKNAHGIVPVNISNLSNVFDNVNNCYKIISNQINISLCITILSVIVIIALTFLFVLDAVALTYLIILMPVILILTPIVYLSVVSMVNNPDSGSIVVGN